VRGITIYNFVFRLQCDLHYISRQVLGSVQSPIQWVLAALFLAVTPNPASVGVGNIVLLMLNNVSDQETIDCIVMSGSSICFLCALVSCPLFRRLEIRTVKVMFLPVKR
jgi:hypothetical protein